MKVRVFCQKWKFIITTSPLQLNHSALIQVVIYFQKKNKKQSQENFVHLTNDDISYLVHILSINTVIIWDQLRFNEQVSDHFLDATVAVFMIQFRAMLSKLSRSPSSWWRWRHLFYDLTSQSSGGNAETQNTTHSSSRPHLGEPWLLFFYCSFLWQDV